MIKLFLFLWMLIPSIANASPALVQACTTYTGASPQTCTMGMNVTAGNLIVLDYQDAGNPQIGDPTIIDTVGNSYIKIVSESANYGGEIETTWIYYAINTTSGPDVVTLTGATGSLDPGYDVSEWSGVDTSVITSSTGTNTGSAYSTGNLSINGAGLLLAIGGNEVAVTNFTAGTGYTILEQQTGHAHGSEYQITSSSGSYAVTMTGDTSTVWTMCSVSFGPSGGATNHGFAHFLR